MNNINISNMTIDDLNSISDNILLDFDDFWTASILKSELSNPNSTYIIAKIDDEIVGFAGIWEAVDDIHITNIVVKKNKRHIGIGNVLLYNLINICKSKKATSITLEVAKTNIPAINLYKKYDFVEVGIRKNYYNNSVDAIIMTMEVNK